MSCKKTVIDTINIYCGEVPVECHFSYGDVSVFPFILAEVRSGSFVGWGETLIRTSDDFIAKAESLLGRNASQLDNLIDEMFISPRDIRGEAFSIALHDLVGQAVNLPVRSLLGKCERKKIPVMPCIFAQTTKQAADKAKQYLSKGVSALKVKLIGQEENDMAIIRAIRNVAPDRSLFLLGDANGGYSLEIMHSGLLKEFKKQGLDAIEDPCDAPSSEYARLRNKNHPAIMIDELARSTSSLKRALEDNAADIVNLHPCQQGSLTEALQRAGICESFNVPVFIGGTGYLGIGTAAHQHIASMAGLNMPCGELGGPFDHGMPMLVDSILPVCNGHVELSNSPGHGVKPRMALLESYIRTRHTFNLRKGTIQVPVPIETVGKKTSDAAKAANFEKT